MNGHQGFKSGIPAQTIAGMTGKGREKVGRFESGNVIRLRKAFRLLKNPYGGQDGGQACESVKARKIPAQTIAGMTEREVGKCEKLCGSN